VVSLSTLKLETQTTLRYCMESFPNARYEFQGVPLTSTIAQSLIRQLFAGKLVERQVLMDEVIREHVNRGGVRAAAQNVSNVFKLALGVLRDAGEATNPSHGYWRIEAADSTDESHGVVAAVHGPEPEPVQPAADFEMGTGAGAVYLYYLPLYRMRAEERGEPAWPCKIGRTSGDPLSRVFTQASTALPEKPHVALVLRTADPVIWETALHSVLALRGRRIDASPGAEWFLTCPAEIMDLAKVFDPALLPDKMLPTQ
jgi:hypothetical protein